SNIPSSGNSSSTVFRQNERPSTASSRLFTDSRSFRRSVVSLNTHASLFVPFVPKPISSPGHSPGPHVQKKARSSSSAVPARNTRQPPTASASTTSPNASTASATNPSPASAATPVYIQWA